MAFHLFRVWCRCSGDNGPCDLIYQSKEDVDSMMNDPSYKIPEGYFSSILKDKCPVLYE